MVSVLPICHIGCNSLAVEPAVAYLLFYDIFSIFFLPVLKILDTL